MNLKNNEKKHYSSGDNNIIKNEKIFTKIPEDFQYVNPLKQMNRTDHENHIDEETKQVDCKLPLEIDIPSYDARFYSNIGNNL